MPVGLVALAAIPVLAGTARLVEIFGGPEIIATDARFAASPAPVVIHVTAAIGYALLGAFQFSTGLRRRHPTWHRRAGRVLVMLGLTVALSALWMTLVFPRKDGTGELLQLLRLLFGTGMTISLVLGVRAILRHDVGRHRAWMMRAYALALGAGTQAFTVGFGHAALGVGVVRTDLMMGAGWAINLAVAEWFIRRRPALRTRDAGAHASLARFAVSGARPARPAVRRLRAAHRRAPRRALVGLARQRGDHPRG